MEAGEQQVVEMVYEVTTSGGMIQGPVTVLEAVSEEEQQHLIEVQEAQVHEAQEGEEVGESDADKEINFTERDLLPYFKRAHIHTRAIEDLLATGIIRDHTMNNNKKNALRQAAVMYRYVNKELFRHGSDREYSRFGLRIVIHDDEPQKRLDVITKAHIDSQGQHLGMNNTIKNIQQVYYWQGISSHVKMYLKRCTVCKSRSKFSAEEWFEGEKRTLGRKAEQRISKEIRDEIRNLGRVKKATPPETFFIVNAQRNIDLDSMSEETEMLIDSNNIEYVVETLGFSEDGTQLKEICHVLNVGDIVAIPERFRSREIETFLRNGTYPTDFTGNQKSSLRIPAAQYAIIDNELYHECSKSGTKVYKLVVHDDQPALKVKIIVECHIDEEGNHLGLNRTLKKVSESYFWFGMTIDVKKFMLKCKVCTSPKGKKFGDSSDQYMEEVQKLKEKDDVSAVSDSVASRPDETLLSLSEIIQQHEAQQAVVEADENHDQVIRLVGTEQGVTEITVSVLDGKYVTSDKTDTTIIGDVSKPSSDTEGFIELQPLKVNELEENDVTRETRFVEKVSDAANAIVVSPTLQASMDQSTQVDDDSQATHTDAGNIALDTQSSLGRRDVPRKGLISYYKDIVYVPTSKKTRAIEAYLKSMSVSHGFTEGRLDKLSVNFCLTDKGVLMRCPSKYKAKQIVVHDDTPEVKLKLIEEYHQKASGDHCSELVTLQTLLFKYYWEEAKADVHRFYIRCNKCVEEGQEIKTRKKIVTLEERAQRKQSNRRVSRDSGSSDSTKQNQKRYQDRLMELKQQERLQGRVHRLPVQTVILEGSQLNLDRSQDQGDGSGVDTADVSNIEIQLGESEDEDHENFVGQDGPLFKMTFMASKDEEDVIREEFENRRWSYQRLSMEEIGDFQSDNSQGDQYRISLLVTDKQQATLVGLLLLQDEDYTTEELNEEELPSQLHQLSIPSTSVAETDTAESAAVAAAESLAGMGNTGIGRVPETMAQVILSNNTADPHINQLPASTAKFQETATNIVIVDGARELTSIQNQVQGAIHTTELTCTNNQAKSSTPIPTLSPGQVSPLQSAGLSEETLDTNQRVVHKLATKDAEKSGPRKQQVVVHTFDSRKDKDASKVLMSLEKSLATPRGGKRKVPEVCTPVQLAVPSSHLSSGGRPRREIKRPRRYSPDREEENSSGDGKQVVNSVSTPGKVEKGLITGRSPGRPKGAKHQTVATPQTHGDLITSSGRKPADHVTMETIRSSPRAARRGTHKETSASTSSQTTGAKSLTKMENGQSQSDSVINKDKLVASSETNEVVRKDSLNVENSEDNQEMELDDLTKKGHYRDVIEDEEEDVHSKSQTKSFNPALQVLLTGGQEKMEVVRGQDGEFICSLCDSHFASVEECLNHGRTEQCIDECALCGKVYRKNQLQEYMSHRTLHEKEEKFQCDHCSKQFYDPDQAQIHRRAHQEQREAGCTQCPQQFHTNFLLASHMLQQHTRSDSFICDVCNAKFVSISYMRSEVLFDGELSFFRCIMCQKAQ